MNSKMRRTASGIMAGGLVVGILAVTPAMAEPDPAAFAVSVSKSTVAVGDEVTVAVEGTSVRDLYAYHLTLDYDESVLEYVPGSAETVLSGSFHATPDEGSVSVLHTKWGSSPSSSGDVDLVTATFRALKVGSATVSVPSLAAVSSDRESAEEDVDSASVKVADTTAPAVVTAPRISGTPKVGKNLAVAPGTWSVAGVKTSVQWLRNGTPIPGATRKTYTIAPGDFRYTLTARVTAKVAGRAEGTAVSNLVRVTRKAASKTKVTAPGSVKFGKKLKVRVRVTAPGVKPSGTVRIRYGGKVVRSKVRLTNGRATVTVKVGRKGVRTLKVIYRPETGVTGSKVTKRVRVR